ncbi:hypothetical protein [Erythrobacter sp. JK5]|uniref:hypothetical protein n=1 Tax=Erythrobacter sp. JK5 TaxID=2829500 RepID=UPI001BA897C0|nr:hypothetical protein [Erythrobacter sp. JK5]QUL37887.1 hypothetical protein KDC96_00140 [Erythrobacter sp. JK5]
MPTGLRNRVHVDFIVDAMENTEANWDYLTQGGRIRNIANVAIARLRMAGVPPPTLNITNIAGNTTGQFDFQRWELKIDRALAASPPGRRAADIGGKVAELGDTIAHESRHCEQWFRMAWLVARRRAQKGLRTSARDICEPLFIRNHMVGTAAIGSGPLLGLALQEAEAWYDSVYGRNKAFRKVNLAAKLRPTGNAIGTAWQDSNYARYQRGLAEEDDAFGIGTEVQRLYLAANHPTVPAARLVRHAPIAQGVANY